MHAVPFRKGSSPRSRQGAVIFRYFGKFHLFLVVPRDFPNSHGISGSCAVKPPVERVGRELNEPVSFFAGNLNSLIH